MVPRLKIDDSLLPKPDAELGTLSDHGQSLDGGSSHKSLGRKSDPHVQGQPSWLRPRLSWFVLSNLLHRHSLLVATLALFSFAVGAYGVSKLKDVYTATAVLILDQSGARLLGSETPPPPNADGEAELLKSENIAIRVIDQLRLTEDPEYNKKAGAFSPFIAGIKEVLTPLLHSLGFGGAGSEESSTSIQDASGVQPLPPEKAAVLQLLKQNIAIRRRGLTDLLAVEATAENPRQAARIANAYAQAYLDEQIAIKAQAIKRAEQILSQQISELNEELKRSESQIGLRQSYQESLVRLRGIAQKRETLSPDARIVSPARPPGGPAFPSARLLGVVGILFSTVAGLGLALGIAAYKETNLYRAYTEDDVEAASGVTNLATIPRLKTGMRRRRRSRELDVRASEATRKLFFNLQIADQRSSKLSAWLITSSRSGDGKSELGLSLGRVAGAAGLKVVIIDCNLKEPQLHETLKLGNDKGLIDLLLSRSDIQGVAQDDPLSDCKFIAAGVADGISAERCMRTDRLKSLMRKLRLEFDVIILVAPPLQKSADPLMFMSLADVALFVVRSGESVLSDLRLDVQQLRCCSESPVFTVMMNAPAKS